MPKIAFLDNHNFIITHSIGMILHFCVVVGGFFKKNDC